MPGDTWTLSNEGRVHARELGERIRSYRVDSGMELSDLAAVTRIGARNLQSLEDGRLEDLPGPVFIKGFIRSICKELGRDAVPLMELLDLVFVEEKPEETEVVNGSRRVTPLIISGVLLVGLIMGGILFHGKSEETKREQVADQTVSVEPEEPVVVEEQDVAEKQIVELDLVLRATERTWLRIQTDNSEQWETTMKAGEEIRLKAMDRITLFIGNAGGILFELNGRRFGPLGTQGQVISNYVITRDNL